LESSRITDTLSSWWTYHPYSAKLRDIQSDGIPPEPAFPFGSKAREVVGLGDHNSFYSPRALSQKAMQTRTVTLHWRAPIFDSMKCAVIPADFGNCCIRK
jgi:hypothetical protein